MLSIHLMSSGSEDYYLGLAAEDYYLAGGEPPGKWAGGGAEMLALRGTVQPDHFRRLFRGVDPRTGEPLVQNVGRPDRRPGWDLTFSAPKSVSVLWSQAPEDTRRRIQEIQQRAVEATMEFAETTLGLSRTGARGPKSIRAKLIAATFEHGTSRAADPQLHTHCLLLNVAVCEDGRTRAIVSKPFFRNKMLLGALYRAHLAHLLQRDLGLAIQRRGRSFELSGVPKELTEIHSKRRKQILGHLAKHGRSGAVAAAKAALETRRTKKNVPPRAELLARWQEQNAEFAFTERFVQNLLGQASPHPNPEKACQKAVQQALANLTRHRTHFTASDLLAETLYEAPELGLRPEALPEAVQDHLQKSPECVPIPMSDGTLRYTTGPILQEEEKLLISLSNLLSRKGASVQDKTLRRVFARRSTIRSDQEKAVSHLTQGKGAVRIVRGLAGTGKTYMLQAALEAWKRQGYRVIGAAPTGKAAAVLQQETGIESDTITMRLGDYKLPLKTQLKHHGRQLARAAKRRKTYRFQQPKPIKITNKTILVVDEAGMVNTRHMRMLLETVEKGGGTIVLTGDPGQLPPVEGGAPFLSISERTGYAQLTEITRQEEEWAREAVRLFARGEPGKALAIYADKGLVRVRHTLDEALRQLVLDWTSVGLTTPERSAIIVATNENSEKANALCQEKRIQAGCVDTSQSLQIFDEDKRDEVTYTNTVHIGDRVIFTRNSRKFGVQNGSLGTVIAINRLRSSIAVQLDDGKRVIVPVKKFRHIRLGYAMTAYKSQGDTFKDTFVLLGGPTQDLPSSYVEGSRHKLTTRFYTGAAVLNEYLEEVEHSPLAAQMARRPDLFMAADLLRPHTIVNRDRKALIEKLLSDWKAAVTTSDPKKSAIITATEEEAQALNRLCLQLLHPSAPPEFSENTAAPAASEHQAAVLPLPQQQPVHQPPPVFPPQHNAAQEHREHPAAKAPSQHTSHKRPQPQTSPTPPPQQTTAKHPTPPTSSKHASGKPRPSHFTPTPPPQQTTAKQSQPSPTSQEQTRQPVSQERLPLAGTWFVRGDRIAFTHDLVPCRVRAGDLATIESFSVENQILKARLDNGRTVTVFLRHYRAIKPAWALTQAQARGLKLENAFVLHPPEPQQQSTTDFFRWQEPTSYQAPYAAAPTQPPAFDWSAPQTTPQSSYNTWQAQQTSYYSQLQYGAAQTQWTQRIQQANQLSYQNTQAQQLDQQITQSYRIAQSWY